MPDVDDRTFRLADGRDVRVTLAPRERRGGGIDKELRTLVFEVVDGEWIGNAPILASYALWSLTREDLQHYFRRARSEEGRKGPMMEGLYDWRCDPPGNEVAKAIRRRVLEALPIFEIGGIQAIREAGEFLKWRMTLDLTGVPNDDRRQVLGLIHSVYDAFCESADDRGMHAVAELLGYLGAPRDLEPPALSQPEA
jgi:hypothetical protein